MYSSKHKCTGSCSLYYFFLHLWMNASICQKCVRAARPHTAPLRREAETFGFDKTTHMTRCSCIVRRTIPILKLLDCVYELFTIWQSLCSHWNLKWNHFDFTKLGDVHRITPNPLHKYVWQKPSNKKAKVFQAVLLLSVIDFHPLSLSSSFSRSLAVVLAQ